MIHSFAVFALTFLSLEAPTPKATISVSETYLLQHEPAPAGSAEGTTADIKVAARAVISLRRIETDGKILFEREVVFADSGVRVLHTEVIVGEQRRLVWREFRPEGAHTWRAEWGGEGRDHTTGYGWHRPVHGILQESLEARAPEMGPLELLYRMRRGELKDGQSVALVEPTAARTTDVWVHRDAQGSRALRVDQTLAVGFDWGELAIPESPEHSLRFHGGGLIARPISDAEFTRRKGRWLIKSRPAHEALLARIVW